MRSLIVLNHAAAPRSAPGGTRHVELFGRLSGWKTAIIAANHNALSGCPDNTEGAGYYTVYTSRSSGNGFRRILSWITFAFTSGFRALRFERPDLIYASSPHLLTGLTGWIVARVRRSRYVLEIRDIWPLVLVDMGRMDRGSLTYRLLEALERFLYRRADQIVILAPGIRSYLEARGVPSDRISCIPNGVDADDFHPSAGRQELRARYGLDGFVVAYTGAHGLANGLDLVLDAAGELQDELPDVHWLLVGDGPEKSRLRAVAEERRLRNVIFHDPVPKTEMPDLLAAADIGLHCLADVELFRYGVSPNKLFDYFAAGLPVITNAGGDTARLVDSSSGGYPVPPDGIAEGVRKMRAMTGDELELMGSQGRDFVRSFYSRSELANRLAEVLDDVNRRAS